MPELKAKIAAWLQEKRSSSGSDLVEAAQEAPSSDDEVESIESSPSPLEDQASSSE